MKQLGNLALVCAKRGDVAMTVAGGLVIVGVTNMADRNGVTCLSSYWDDDKQIEQIIQELNFGKFRLKE